jgi:hypothetical protein
MSGTLQPKLGRLSTSIIAMFPKPKADGDFADCRAGEARPEELEGGNHFIYVWQVVLFKKNFLITYWNKTAYGGGGGIRTHGGFHHAGFQDRSVKPLRYPSEKMNGNMSENIERKLWPLMAPDVINNDAIGLKNGCEHDLLYETDWGGGNVKIVHETNNGMLVGKKSDAYSMSFSFERQLNGTKLHLMAKPGYAQGRKNAFANVGRKHL